MWSASNVLASAIPGPVRGLAGRPVIGGNEEVGAAEIARGASETGRETLRGAWAPAGSGTERRRLGAIGGGRGALPTADRSFGSIDGRGAARLIGGRSFASTWRGAP